MLIRDVAYESLPKALRATKHIEAARWAEDSSGERAEEVAHIIARHYEQALSYARQLGDDAAVTELQSKLFEWSRLAGQRTERLWQSREAAHWYRVAIDLALEDAGSREELAQLWRRYGRTIFGMKPYEETALAYQQALRLYEELGQVESAGRIESKLAEIAFEAGRDDDVSMWAERALARLEPLGDGRALAGALHILGWYHWRRGRFAEAEPLLKRCVAMLEDDGSSSLRGHALQTLGALLVYTNHPEQGLAMLEESHRIARECGDLSLLLRSFNNLSGMLFDYSPGDERVFPMLEEGVELARRAGNKQMEGWILGTHGQILADLGRLEEAERMLEAAHACARVVGNRPLLGQRLHALAVARLFRGQVPEARSDLEEAETLLAENPELQNEAWRHIGKALLLQHDHDDEGAARALVSGVAAMGGSFGVEGGTILLVLTARALRSLGWVRDAVHYRDLLRDSAAAAPVERGFERWADGLAEEDPARRADMLEQASAQLEVHGRSVWQALCLIDLARAGEDAGTDPRPALERARKLLHASGALLFLPEIDEFGVGDRDPERVTEA